MRKESKCDGRDHVFGGAWTAKKLEVLQKYLREYTKVLKKNSFCKGYIDAFAGTGYRYNTYGENKEELEFEGLAQDEQLQLLEGSAIIALKCEPRFDKYIFIEKSKERCDELKKLKNLYPDKADDITIDHGDANQIVQNMCRLNWKSHRAVLFLDPYGMQVKWETIEAVASTKAIDLWVLFPLYAVNRLLKKNGDIPSGWRSSINQLLGTEEWYDEFYTVLKKPDLFNNSLEYAEKAPMEVIGRFFIKRLKNIFAGVTDKPGVLKNSTNSPLYLLCFAVANERGRPVALRIANHLLREIR